MRKRILRSFVGLIILAAFTVPSCDFIESCGTCDRIVEVDGVIDEEASVYGIPYCGDALIDKQNESPLEVGNTVSYYICY